MKAHPGTAFSRATKEGSVKFATVRTGDVSGMLVLTVEKNLSHDLRLDTDVMLEAMVAALKDLTSRTGYRVSLVVCETVHPADVSCIPGGRVIFGDSWFQDRLGGATFDVPYDAFFQPNPSAFDELLRWCTKQLSPLPASSTLYDLYCGSGTLSKLFSSAFPGRFQEIVGFEFIASAADTAARAHESALLPAKFHALDLNQPGALHLNADNALVVCDPPRPGLSDEVKRALMEASDRIPHILYISCNPDSQIRDLAHLSSAYAPVSAAIADCYPQTPHLEQAVLLSKREPV
ncbi:MAG: hypothetical protein HY042_06190 [Spirochaetia bacterium]|nr:hypothetical protein [Spirochaetia bacterium]